MATDTPREGHWVQAKETQAQWKQGSPTGHAPEGCGKSPDWTVRSPSRVPENGEGGRREQEETKGRRALASWLAREHEG